MRAYLYNVSLNIILILRYFLHQNIMTEFVLKIMFDKNLEDFIYN
jgi:hypothetical protein